MVERYRLLTSFLDDVEVRDLRSDKRFLGGGAGESYRRLEVRNLAAIELAVDGNRRRGQAGPDPRGMGPAPRPGPGRGKAGTRQGKITARPEQYLKLADITSEFGGSCAAPPAPGCGFWADADVLDRMLAQGDSWAFSRFGVPGK